MAGRKQKFAKQAQALAAIAKAGRKAEVGAREPSGKLSRAAAKLVSSESVGEIRRLRDAALSGMRDPIWGTQLGRLYLADKIHGAQFRAGRKWGDVIARWRRINLAPSINPRSGLVSLLQGNPEKPETLRHFRATDGSDEQEAILIDLVNDALLSFGRGPTDPALVAVRECCEMDRAPFGYEGLLALQQGLDHLVVLWSVEA